MNITTYPSDGAASHAFRMFGDATEEFRLALQSFWLSPEHETTVINSFTRYSSLMYQATQNADQADQAARAFAQYEQAVRDAFDLQQVKGGVQDAFDQYLRAIASAWATTDPASITPPTLAGLAEGMSWVAGVAGIILRLATEDKQEQS